MNNKNTNPILNKIREQWLDSALISLPGVPENKTADEIFKLVVDADPSPPKQMVSWILKTWENNGINYADIEGGQTSRIQEALSLFLERRPLLPHTNRSMMTQSSLIDIQQNTRLIDQIQVSTFEDKQKVKKETFHHEISNNVSIDMPLTLFAWEVFLNKETSEFEGINIDDIKSFQNNGPVFLINTPEQRYCAFIGLDSMELNSLTSLKIIDMNGCHININKLKTDIKEDIIQFIQKQLLIYNENNVSNSIGDFIKYKLSVSQDNIKSETSNLKDYPITKNKIDDLINRIKTKIGTHCFIEQSAKHRIDVEPKSRLPLIMTMAHGLSREDFFLLSRTLFVGNQTIRNMSLSEMRTNAPFILNDISAERTIRILLERIDENTIEITDACKMIREGLNGYFPKEYIQKHLGTIAKGYMDQVYDKENQDWRVYSVMASIMKEQSTLSEIVSNCVENPESLNAISRLIIDKSMIAGDHSELDDIPLTASNILEIAEPYSVILQERYAKAPIDDVKVLSALELILSLQVQLRKNLNLNKDIGIILNEEPDRQKQLRNALTDLITGMSFHTSIENAIKNYIMPKAKLLGLTQGQLSKEEIYIKDYFDSMVKDGALSKFSTPRLPSCQNIWIKNLPIVMAASDCHGIQEKTLEVIKSAMVPMPSLCHRDNSQWSHVVKAVTKIIEIGGEDFAEGTVSALSYAKTEWEAVEATRYNLEDTMKMGPLGQYVSMDMQHS